MATDIDDALVPLKIENKAKQLGLKKPQLPLPTLCMDGVPYTEVVISPRTRQRRTAEKQFSSVMGDLDNRLELLGAYWFDNSVLEFVGPDGKYYLARDVDSNIKSLKEAGFRVIEPPGPGFNNSDDAHVGEKWPVGKAGKLLQTILETLENENERLEKAVWNGDLEQYDLAIANGAKIEEIEQQRLKDEREPLLFDALFYQGVENIPGRDAIIGCLVRDGAHLVSGGRSLLHHAMGDHYPDSDKDMTYALHILPELLKIGISPFARDDTYDSCGVPVFLYLDPYQPDARDKLKIMTGAMCSVAGITKREEQIIKAQAALIDQALAQGDRRQASAAINLLAHVWKAEKRIFGDALEETSVPLRALTMLEPLIDPQRKPKLQNVLTNYDFGRIPMIDNLVGEFTLHVALPLHLSDYFQRTGQAITDESLRDLDERFARYRAEKNKSDADLPEAFREPNDLAYLAVKAMPVVAAELFKGRSLDQIVGLSEAWHAQGVGIPAELLPIRAQGEWYPLTKEKELQVPGKPGVSLHVLTNADELRDEGKNMGHCVGKANFTVRCLNAQSHILSVRQDGERLSTVEATWNGKTLKILQHFGYANEEAPQIAQEAVEWLKEQFNPKKKGMKRGKIKLSDQLGETEESKAARALRNTPKILEAIGFPLDPEHIGPVFQEYGLNHRRRARGYNPETGKFDLISRSTELVSGNYHRVVEDENGKRTTESVAYRKLPVATWFEASGLRDKIWAASPLREFFEHELALRNALQEQQINQSAQPQKPDRPKKGSGKRPRKKEPGGPI